MGRVSTSNRRRTSGALSGSKTPLPASVAPPFFAFDGGGSCSSSSVRRGCSRDLKKSVRQEAEGDVPVPGFPAPHFILVQPDLSLSPLKALLDAPTAAGSPSQFLKRGSFGTVCPVVGQILRIPHRAARQKPLQVTVLRQIWQTGASPLVKARPLAAFTYLHLLPRLHGRFGYDLLHPSLHGDAAFNR